MHLLSPAAFAALLSHVSPLAVFAAAQLGFVMPLIVSALSQPRFSKRTREILSVVSCFVGGIVVCVANGVFSGLNVGASVVILLTVSGVLYDRFYKPSGFAPWFEKVTTLGTIVIGAFGKNALAGLQGAVQSASSTATAAIEQSNSPLALPSPQTAQDVLSAAASQAAAQAEDAADKAGDVAAIAGAVATEAAAQLSGLQNQ